MSPPAGPPQDDARFRVERDRLLESEAFYRGVVTCTGDAVIVRELGSGQCIEANPAACTLFGYSTVQFQSVTARELLAPPGDQLWAQIHDALVETGRSDRHALFLGRDVPVTEMELARR